MEKKKGSRGGCNSADGGESRTGRVSIGNLFAVSQRCTSLSGNCPPCSSTALMRASKKQFKSFAAMLSVAHRQGKPLPGKYATQQMNGFNPYARHKNPTGHKPLFKVTGVLQMRTGFHPQSKIQALPDGGTDIPQSVCRLPCDSTALPQALASSCNNNTTLSRGFIGALYLTAS